MKIGFTGTQRGMTYNQKETFNEKILQFDMYTGGVIFHHGDCIGADEQAHEIAIKNGCYIIIHPPYLKIKRAFCEGELRAPLPYLDRNKKIVDETSLLIACPGEDIEQLRSGTWSTIRYARKIKKKVWIIYPDGRLQDG